MKATGVAAIASVLTGSTSAETAGSSAESQGRGPVRKSRFVVEIDGISVAGFSRVELPSASTEPATYREGNDPSRDRKLAGRNEYDDLTLERGVQSEDLSLWDWRKQVIDGQEEGVLRDVAVTILDRAGNPQVRYEFTKAWPKEYSPPDLDASAVGGDSAMATEELTIAYDEYERTQ